MQHSHNEDPACLDKIEHRVASYLESPQASSDSITVPANGGVVPQEIEAFL
jgi:hypothetical protein